MKCSKPPQGNNQLNCLWIVLLLLLLSKSLNSIVWILLLQVLIFCQMLEMLDFLEDYCELRDYRYSRLDGKMSLEDRSTEVSISVIISSVNY